VIKCLAVVESKIAGHWLTFTTPYEADDVLRVLGGGHGEAEPTWAYGQKARVVHESGTSVYFGSPRKDQPVAVTLTGEVCEGYWAEGLDWCERLEGRVTRADLANDVGPDELARGRLIEMVSAWRRGRVATKMKRTSHDLRKSDRPGDGWTAYFGGKTADVKLRVYDRRGPLRLEWQWGPPRELAPHVASFFKRPDGLKTWWGRLAQAAVWPMPWYQALLAGDEERVPGQVEDQTRFDQAVAAHRDQFGASLWALQLLGLKLEDLLVDPGPQLRGDVAAKFTRWSKEAEKSGYDGAALRREITCRLKSKPKLD
jgi:hypothetical protein